MSCFLSDHISEESFEKGKAAIRKFVLSIEQLYGNAVLMKFNTHLLLHIPKSVEDFGGLWAWSTFKYEHYNGLLGKLFKSSQSAQLQICKNYLRLQGMRENARLMLEDDAVPACAKQVLEDFHHGRQTKYVFSANAHFKMLGVPLCGSLSIVQLNVVQRLLGIGVRNHNVKFYKRFIYRNVLYHIKDNLLLKNRNNSVVRTTDADNKYVMITHAVKVETDEDVPQSKIIILAFKLEPTNDVLCGDWQLRISSKDILQVVSETNQCVGLLPQMLQRKCVYTFYPGDPDKFCCIPLANLHERD
ncbi:hypothetical protein FOCC_FOCC015620 [Frankliniella occidentalis]|nr:hypothetical protein FOCC_FOCC015620 [Frankliniella occidentalis]